jgi:aminoglycoside phosphotransferase (APT) family kinase protein
VSSLPADPPDVLEIVDSADEAAALALPPLLVRRPLERFLDEHGLGEGPLEACRCDDGHSNVTYRITRAGCRVVLRRPPRPPLPPSAHDVLREARILAALEGSGVPVPRVLAVCADESLLGVPFFVMEYLDGCCITAATPAALATPAHRAEIAERLIEVLAALHAVDPAGCGLDGIGRPSGYLERQVRRFAGLWEAGRTRELPALDELTAWLAANRPESGPATVVHGDFRLGNLMFAREPPVELLGVLDWEMATLGDPLADLGYLTASWGKANGGTVMAALQAVTREDGFPDADALAARYAALTGRAVDDLRWYRVLALWKSAIFLEQSYKRFLSGTEHDPWFAGMADGVPGLVAHARREAGLEEER